ncbi:MULTISPECIES: universal stress protein [unclassified Halorhabdus]|uniref:universal stress protein n=1 Tax=unclassified Halorhabdus TaxID=2621901 RepID=UPI0023DC6E36|nr:MULTISPECIES: universal stress protein [unclassified Halorhabdus]WEL17316.1 Nucleotide-binding protein, UspA family [Halorhabdus sp. SVX81]WEL21199.1 Nucleotide-binding protein, UspA family [Halorhabdus sp. BNX81]
MYETILAPTDGSSGTAKTLDHAISIAGDNDATIHGLYVLDRRMYLAAEDDAQDEVMESLESDGEKALARLREQVEDAGVTVETELQEGIPHRGILSYAEDIGADLIVMGTHGRTGRDRLANLGSVTQRVIENADVPVFVVNIEN